MERVLTINYWWDGPLMGLAYFDGSVCIYERIFDDAKDDYLDEYFLTPINDCEQSEILSEWKEWCDAVSVGDLDSYYAVHRNECRIKHICNHSDSKRMYRKKASFQGKIDTGWIPADYYVEWCD